MLLQKEAYIGTATSMTLKYPTYCYHCWRQDCRRQTTYSLGTQQEAIRAMAGTPRIIFMQPASLWLQARNEAFAAALAALAKLGD